MRGWGLLTAVLVLLIAPAAEAAFPGENGRIAFERVTGDSSIVSVRPDGSRVRELSRGGSPSYSDDGRVAYYCFGVCTMNAKGSGNRVVNDRGGDPAFSASGEQIAFVQCDRIRIPGRCINEVWLVRDDGSNPRPISPRGPTDDQPADQPAFSSRGLIAFNRKDSIWTMRLDGSAQDRLATGSSPDFSPDGQRLVFSRGRAIATLPVSGGEPRRVIRGSEPTWSPNGRRIAYVDIRPTPEGGVQRDIFTVKVNGDDPRRVTRTPTYETYPSWGGR